MAQKHEGKVTTFILLVFPQAETRAEFAERSVAKLEKTIDDLEGMEHIGEHERGRPCPLISSLWSAHQGIGSDLVSICQCVLSCILAR